MGRRAWRDGNRERSYSYEFAGAIPFHAAGHADHGRRQGIIEWGATFDCAPAERDRWTRYFEEEGFAVWLGSLREHLAARRD